MYKKFHINKKFPFICSFVTLLLLCLFYFNTYKHNQFSKLCNDLMITSLENNPIELHFSIAYPDALGLSELSNDLVPYTSSYYEDSITTWSNFLERLNTLDTSNFSKDEFYTYDLLRNDAHARLTMLSFPYMENPLSSFSGIHNQLPVLLVEYSFRNKQDIENYLRLLEQIPAYFDGMILYASDQTSHSILPNKQDIETSATQCLDLFSTESIKKHSHFLYQSFESKLQASYDASIITASEISNYTSKHDTLIATKVYPAYQKLATDLLSLPVREQLLGLAHYPNGSTYYEFLLQNKVGTTKDISQIKQQLYDDFDSLYKTYYDLLSQKSTFEIRDFPFKTEDAMLSHLYESSLVNFPQLPISTDSIETKIQVKEVEENMENMSAPAFYLTPPIDSNQCNTIYINPSSNLTGLSLYTTLAHEGFPGHLYQTVYSQTKLSQADAPFIQQLLYHGGFSEGWGIYSELYAHDFLLDCLGPEDEQVILYDALSRKLQLCLSSIIDIMIHYEGATLSDIETLLTNLHFNVSIADTLYESICLSPGNYPMYYVGYLEIMELKKSAQDLWKDSYTDLLFHTWLLNLGAGDFTSIKQALYR